MTSQLELAKRIVTILRRANKHDIPIIPLADLKQVLGIPKNDDAARKILKRALEDVLSRSKYWKLEDRTLRFIHGKSCPSSLMRSIKTLDAIETLSETVEVIPADLRQKVEALALETIQRSLEPMAERLAKRVTETVIAALQGRVGSIRQELKAEAPPADILEAMEQVV